MKEEAHTTGAGSPPAGVARAVRPGLRGIVTAVLVALGTALLLTGCATKPAQAAAPAVTSFPQEQLCRIGQLRTSGRYVALITSECASGTKIVGLRSARSPEELKRMGAN